MKRYSHHRQASSTRSKAESEIRRVPPRREEIGLSTIDDLEQWVFHSRELVSLRKPRRPGSSRSYYL